MANEAKMQTVASAGKHKTSSLSDLFDTKTQNIGSVTQAKQSKISGPPNIGGASLGMRAELLFSESSNNYSAVNQQGYTGGFQFGAMALETLGYLVPGASKLGNSALLDPANWTGKNGMANVDMFKNNPGEQDLAFQANTQSNFKQLKNLGVLTDDSTQKDVDGYLAAAHLLGATGAANNINNADANGTTGQDYFNKAKDYYPGIDDPENDPANQPAEAPASLPVEESLADRYRDASVTETLDALIAEQANSNPRDELIAKLKAADSGPRSDEFEAEVASIKGVAGVGTDSEITEQTAKQVEDLAAMQAREKYIADRNVGEFAQDTASSLITGIIDIAGTAYGLANFGTGGGLDAAVASMNKEGKVGSQYLEDAKAAVRDTMDSSTLTAMEARQQARSTYRQAQNAEKYDNEWAKFGANFLDAAGEYATSPGLSADAVFDSLPQMFVPGVIASKIVGGVVKQGAIAIAKKNLAKRTTPGASQVSRAYAKDRGEFIPKKQIKTYMASDAGKKAISDIQTRTGLSYIAASEGVSNGLQIQAEILNASFNDLKESSPKFRKLLLQGESPEKARKSLANEAALITGGISALFGLGAAKISGAGKLEGAMFKVDSKVGKGILSKMVSSKLSKGVVASKVVRGTVSEGVEETLQGGSGEFGGNVGKKNTTNPEQDLVEGVADAAAQGLVVGSLSGGGMVGLSNVPAGVSKTVGATLSGVNKAASAVETATSGIGKAAKEIRTEREITAAIERDDPKELTPLIDPTDKNYSPEIALRIVTSPQSMPPKDSDKWPEYLDIVDGHYANLDEKIMQGILRNQVKLDKAEKDGRFPSDIKKLQGQQDLLMIAFENAANERTRINEIRSESEMSVPKLFEALADINKADNKKRNEVLGRVFGSAATVELVEKAIESGELNETEAAEAAIVLESLKSIDGVSGDIANGGAGFEGLKQYRAKITKDIELGSSERAQTRFSRLSKFVAGLQAKQVDFNTANDVIQNTNSTEAEIDAAVSVIEAKYQKAPGKNGKRENYKFRRDVGFLKNVFKGLSANINADANGGVAVVNEVQAAHAKKFNKPLKQVETVDLPVQPGEATSATVNPKIAKLESKIEEKQTIINNPNATIKEKNAATKMLKRAQAALKAEAAKDKPSQAQAQRAETGSGDPEASTAVKAPKAGTRKLLSKFVGKIILAHAGIGKSFAAKSNPNLIDGDDLFTTAANKIVRKYNKENNETVSEISNVSEMRSIFTAWGEYTKSPAKTKEARKRRDEIYAEYAKEAVKLKDQGKTVLSSSVRDPLVAVADFAIVQENVELVGENLTSDLRVNQDSETDSAKIKGKIAKLKKASTGIKNGLITLQQNEFLSDGLFEGPQEEAAPKIGEYSLQEEILLGTQELVEDAVDGKRTPNYLATVLTTKKLVATKIAEVLVKLQDIQAKLSKMTKKSAKKTKLEGERAKARRELERLNELRGTTGTIAGLKKYVAMYIENANNATVSEDFYDEISEESFEDFVRVIDASNVEINANTPLEAIQDAMNDPAVLLKAYDDITGIELKSLGNLLEVIPNFFAEARNKNSAVRKLLESQLDVDELKILDDIVKYELGFVKTMLVGWKGGLATFPNVRHEKHRHLDLASLWLKKDKDGKTSIDPNMASQMALISYTWLATQSEMSLSMPNEMMNAILGVTDRSARVSYANQKALKEKGLPRDDVRGTIGQTLMEALGLQVSPTAPAGFKSRMELAFGEVITATMLEMNIIEHDVITKEELIEMRADIKSGLNAQVETGFNINTLKVIAETGKDKTGQKALVPKSRVVEIIDFYRNGKGDKLIETLFVDTEKDNKPVFNKSDLRPVKSTAKGTNTAVTAAQQKALNEHQEVEQKTKEDVTEVFMNFDESFQLDMLGYDSDVAGKLEIQQKSIESSNEKIIRDLSDIKSWLERLQGMPGKLKTGFYYAQEVWSNTRMGIIGGRVNIQGSKIARGFFGPARHNITISTEGSRTENVTLHRFKLGVAESLDLTTKSDKDAGIKVMQTDAEVLKALEEGTTGEGVYAEAVQILMSKQKDFTAEEQTVIATAVKEAGEGMHSFEGLIAIARFKQGQASSNKEFTTSHSKEIDGVNNGVIFAILQYMPDAKKELVEDLLNRGGVFFDSAHRSYVEYKRSGEEGQRDLYELIAMDWKGALTETSHALTTISEDTKASMNKDNLKEYVELKYDGSKTEANKDPEFRAGLLNNHLGNPNNLGADGRQFLISLSSLVGRIDRSLAKNPLMVFVYGASAFSISQAIARGTVDSLYDRISEAFNMQTGPEKTKALKDLENALNDVMHKYPNISADRIILSSADTNWKDFSFSDQQVSALGFGIHAVYGSTLDAAFDKYFKVLRDRREKVNETINDMHAMHMAVFNARIDAAVVVNNNVPLTKEQENEIELEVIKLAPIFKTFTAEEQETVTSGIDPTKTSLIKKTPESNVNEAVSVLRVNYNKIVDSYNRKSTSPERKSYLSRVIAALAKREEERTKEDNKTLLIEARESYGFVEEISPLVNETKFANARDKKALRNTEGLDKLRSVAKKRVMDAPGVSAPVMGTQGQDASTMVGVMGKFDFLNVHDAGYIAYDQEEAFGKALNDSWAENAFDYDMLAEIVISMNETFDAFAEEAAKDKSLLKRLDETRDPDPVTNETRSYDDMLKGQTDLQKSSKQATKRRKASRTKFNKAGFSSQYNSNLDRDILNPSEATRIANLTEEEAAAEIQKHINDTFEEIKGSSSKAPLNPKDFNEDPDFTTDPLETGMQSPEGIFDELATEGNVLENTKHTSYLRKLLVNLSNKHLEPFRVFMRTVTDKDEETRGEYHSDGNVVYMQNANNAQVNGLQMSSQATYVHEIVHAITEFGVSGNSRTKRELVRLYRHAKKVMSPADFLPEGNSNPSQVDLDAAQERYDYVFNNQAKTPKGHTQFYTTGTEYISESNYLHEFMAFGLTDENFIKSLSKITPPESQWLEGDTFGEKLVNLFNKILEAFDTAFAGNRGLTADKKLLHLAEQLAVLTEKNKLRVANKVGIQAKVNTAFKGVVSAIIVAPLKAAVNTKMITESRSKIVQAAGKNLGHILNEELPFEPWFEALQLVRRRMGSTSRTFVNSLAREIVGVTARTQHWHAINAYSNKQLDQNHKAVASAVSKHSLGAFLELDKDENESIYYVGMRTDLSAIYRDYTSAEIVKLMSDKSFLAKEIAKKKKELAFVPKNILKYYLAHTESLANIMINGAATQRGSHLNVHTMANVRGTDLRVKQATANKAQDILDKLVSLEAISKTQKEHKKKFVTVMQQEMNRDDSGDSLQNGMHFLMQNMEEHKKVTITDAFASKAEADVLMTKGYTKDVYDPNVSFKVGPGDPQTVADMQAEGFVKKRKPIGTDRTNPNQSEHFLYVNYDSQLSTYQRSSMSTTQETAAGTDVIKVREQSGHDLAALAGATDGSTITARNMAAARNLAKPNTTSDVAKDENLLVPIFNPDGDVVGHRYMMTEHNRNTILNRDSSFEKVMGNMMASVEDKKYSRIVNNKIIDDLKTEYDEGFKKNPGEFIRISENSKIPEHVEMWRMLPSHTREYVKNKFGSEEIFIRDGIVDLVFGRRKFSMAEFLAEKGNKLLTERVNKVIFDAIKVDLSKILNINLRQIEHIWMDTVSIIKDTIVIKTITVLQNNIISNTAALLMLGVSPIDIVKGHIVAIRHATAYRRGLERVRSLTLDMNTSKGLIADANTSTINRVKLERGLVKQSNELAMLQTELAENPVRELNEAGVYQTIVEDVDLEDEQYTYKNKLQNWSDPVVSKIPQGVRTTARHLFMMHDTPVYKFLRDATQLSDFIARYTLHEHNLKNKNMSKKDSVQHIVNTFINYDLPTHQYVQWANDVGLIMFTKFMFRIQRVILQTAKGNPVNVLGYLLLEGLIDTDSPDIGDSIMTPWGVWDRANLNPFGLITSGIAEGFGVKTASGVIP